MTEKDSKALLNLANAWETASKQYEKAKNRSAGIADDYQNKGDLRMRDVHLSEAASNEIRSEMLKLCSQQLALKVGKLLVGHPGASSSSERLPATGTERLSAKNDDPKDIGPFSDQRRGEVA